MAMKKRDLLNPKQMVETKGGYAELQPVSNGAPAGAGRDAVVTECGVDCERDRARHPAPAVTKRRRR